MNRGTETLVRAVLAGESGAWQALVTTIAPEIEAIARSHSSMRRLGLARLHDDVAEVTTATLERLARHEYRNLTRYLAQRDEPGAERTQSFESWLYGAADYAIREHLRKCFGRAGAHAGTATACDARGHAHLPEDDELSPSFVDALSVTNKLSLAEIFAFIDCEFEADEATAMRLYYQQAHSFDQLAAALGLSSARDAEKLIRRLNARLRHRFAAADA